MKGFVRKFVSSLLVLMLVAVLLPVGAKAKDVAEDFKNPIVMTHLKEKLGEFSEAEIIELINLIREIDEENIILENVFENLKGTDLYSRLEQRDITQTNVEKFINDVKSYVYNDKNWESWLKDVHKSITDGKTALSNEQVEWLKGIDKKFEDSFPKLNKYIIEKFENDTYRSKFNFARFCKQVFDVIADNVKIKYDNGNFSITSWGNLDDEEKGINSLLNDWGIQGLETKDIEALKSAVGDIIKEFNSLEVNKDFVAKALESFGFDVEGYPSGDEGDDGEDDEEEPGTPGGGTGGGAGGGEEVAPGKPELEIPKDETKPVEVKVPADAVKVKVVNGKATVTFDEETIEELLGLLDEAEEKAKGRKVVLVIDLAENNDIDDSAVVELPAAVIKKAYEKGAVVTANFKKFALDLPAGAFDVKDTNAVKLTFEFKNVTEAIRNINTANIANMKPVGSALDIELIVGENPVSLKNKVTLRFSVKGLTTNIDKLGVYYIDEKAGKVEFVGGKVDRAKGEIKANLQHLSTYALFEYNITFDDMAAHWAKAYIESMAAKHVVHGRTEQKFVPNDGITRAEFAKLMVTALELDLVPYKGSFEDVKSDAWYADYVQTAYENGIITGRVEGKVFDPNAKIMRQEIMAMVGRALGKQAIRPVDALLASFKDADKVAQYAKEHAALLVELGIVGGYPDGTLRPWENTTRAEAVKLIYGLYNNF